MKSSSELGYAYPLMLPVVTDALASPESQPKSRIQRMKMLAYAFFGLTLASLHHFLYTRLSGRPAEGPSISLRGHDVLNQTVVKSIGNALSIAAGTSFSSAIGIAFAQYFWRVLRAASHRVKHIDAAFAASNGSPLSTLLTVPMAPVLALMAMVTVAEPLLTVFAPGSLSIVTEQFSVPKACSVSTSNITRANLASYSVPAGDTSGIAYLHNPTIRTSTLVTRVILGGSYILPPSPCGSCSYNVSFVGAGANCTWATESRPPMDLQVPEGPTTWLGIWNATYSWANNTRWTLQLSVRNGSYYYYYPLTTYECRAYRADYTVRVTHGNVSTAEVLSVSLQDPIPGSIISWGPQSDHVMRQLNGILGAVGNQLNGSIVYQQGYCDFDTATSLMASSPILNVGNDCVNKTDPVFMWPDMRWAIPSLIQNVSISLLSGQYPSAEKGSYLEDVDTVCLTSPLTYHYDPTELLVTYATALLAVVVSLCIGFCAISANGCEEDLSLIRFLKALSTEDVASASVRAVGNMNATVEDRQRGMIIISEK
ncbi:hypothetical protein CVT26_012066 [Gymnopilus dilepis]|uniref:Uncharacterized protein n=1 Tax=Gymnopilus dilepis TaxID=231916 RepID=A0A409W964_9AGAR|nr:hypothetical protein CVT26_012066 [Gymnopilus dilepis]